MKTSSDIPSPHLDVSLNFFLIKTDFSAVVVVGVCSDYQNRTPSAFETCFFACPYELPMSAVTVLSPGELVVWYRVVAGLDSLPSSQERGILATITVRLWGDPYTR